MTHPPSTTQRMGMAPPGSLPPVNTFSGLSDFLRSAIADEDSRQFSESMGAVAAQAEVVVAGLRASRSRASAAPLLMDMLGVVRAHRSFVVQLGLAWRGLYEYPAYLQALNNLRVLIGQWLQPARGDDQLDLRAEEFERVAWRTMGEGMLLVDMYEQWLERDMPCDDGAPRSNLGELTEPQVQQVLQWWQKLKF